MIYAIIQARIGSTRLPGKVLKRHRNKTMLEVLVSRLSHSKLVETIIVATSDLAQDDPISNLCKENGWLLFRGSETDCLDRYYQSAQAFGAQSGDTIVRITGDCPLIDPELVDKVVGHFFERNVDYAANNTPPEARRFPDGSDVEVFTFDALARAWKEAESAHDREHVTFYLWKNNNNFKISQYSQIPDESKFRITLDYSEDYEVITFILDELDRTEKFGSVSEIVNILEQYPSVAMLNSHRYYGEGWKIHEKASKHESI